LPLPSEPGGPGAWRRGPPAAAAAGGLVDAPLRAGPGL